MRIFILMAHKASTIPFNLNDLAGAAGRMDLVARFISSSLFISHGIRKDTEVYTILNGPTDPPKTIKFVANELKMVSPDERNIASHIRNALFKKISSEWILNSPGIYIARKSLEDILIEIKSRNVKIYLLDEKGRDIQTGISEGAFVMSDHINFSESELATILKYADDVLSLTKTSLHADHCAIIVNYYLDRLKEGKTISPPSR